MKKISKLLYFCKWQAYFYIIGYLAIGLDIKLLAYYLIISISYCAIGFKSLKSDFREKITKNDGKIFYFINKHLLHLENYPYLIPPLFLSIILIANYL